MNREQYFGSVVIISGPSGVGKTTLFHHLQKLHKQLHFSVSCTTRAKRPGELDGMAYHFIDEAAFEAHVKKGDFLECAQVYGAHYGTLIAELECIKKGKDLLLDIDVQGMKNIRSKLKAVPFFNVRLVTVFILPPSVAELERRLRGRKTETEEAIQRRLVTGKDEMAEWRDYDYVIINDKAEEAAAELDAVIKGSHFKTPRITEDIWNA